MSVIDLGALLSFAGLIAAWGLLPANGYAKKSQKEESKLVELQAAQKG